MCASFKCDAQGWNNSISLYIHLLLQRQSRIHSFSHHLAVLWHSELHPTSRQRAWPRSGRTQPLSGRRGTVPFCTVKLHCWTTKAWLCLNDPIIKTWLNLTARLREIQDTRILLKVARSTGPLRRRVEKEGRMSLTDRQPDYLCFMTPRGPTEEVILAFSMSACCIFLSLQPITWCLQHLLHPGVDRVHKLVGYLPLCVISSPTFNHYLVALHFPPSERRTAGLTWDVEFSTS